MSNMFPADVHPDRIAIHVKCPSACTRGRVPWWRDVHASQHFKPYFNVTPRVSSSLQSRHLRSCHLHPHTRPRPACSINHLRWLAWLSEQVRRSACSLALPQASRLARCLRRKRLERTTTCQMPMSVVNGNQASVRLYVCIYNAVHGLAVKSTDSRIRRPACSHIPGRVRGSNRHAHSMIEVANEATT